VDVSFDFFHISVLFSKDPAINDIETRIFNGPEYKVSSDFSNEKIRK
jgi:hypothetical protein